MWELIKFAALIIACNRGNCKDFAENHADGVYGIATKERMESSRSDVWHQSEGERALIRASRDAMRDFVGVPYNAWGALMPYQSFGFS